MLQAGETSASQVVACEVVAAVAVARMWWHLNSLNTLPPFQYERFEVGMVKVLQKTRPVTSLRGLKHPIRSHIS